MSKRNKQPFSDEVLQINSILKQKSINCHNNNQVKSKVIDFYKTLARTCNHRRYLNWGLYDYQLIKELNACKLPFSLTHEGQDINGPLLPFYLVKPLLDFKMTNPFVLDIGCGNGASINLYRHLLKTNNVIGLDLSCDLLANAKQYLDNTNLVNGDAECLPFASNSIDVITNLESSHLYPNIEQFFNEVFRVLKPGGYFCYADFDACYKYPEKTLEKAVALPKNLSIVIKRNITKMVQASIYQRIISNEHLFCGMVKKWVGDCDTTYIKQLPYYAMAAGALFLPWRKRRFRNTTLKGFYSSSILKSPSRNVRQYYYYYLIQKI